MKINYQPHMKYRFKVEPDLINQLIPIAEQFSAET